MKGRVVSIELRDNAGVQSDTATIIVDNRGGLIEPPKKGVELEISLGFAGAPLVAMGRFTVSSRATEGPVRLITIDAAAVDLRIGARSPKTRAWDDATLDGIVSAIAGEHGLTPAVAAGLRAVAYDHLDQTGESDLHFLTRLALDLGAVAKVAEGRLIVAWRGRGETVGGGRLPRVDIAKGQLTSWRVRDEDRTRHLSCVAWWHAHARARREKVVAGEGEPSHELRRPYPSADAARRAAEAKLAALNRGAMTLAADLAVAALDLRAEQPLRLSGCDDLADGDWITTSVTHRLDGALTTTLSAERAEEDTE